MLELLLVAGTSPREPWLLLSPPPRTFTRELEGVTVPRLGVSGHLEHRGSRKRVRMRSTGWEASPPPQHCCTDHVEVAAHECHGLVRRALVLDDQVAAPRCELDPLNLQASHGIDDKRRRGRRGRHVLQGRATGFGWCLHQPPAARPWLSRKARAPRSRDQMHGSPQAPVPAARGQQHR